MQMPKVTEIVPSSDHRRPASPISWSLAAAHAERTEPDANADPLRSLTPGAVDEDRFARVW
jgi:hypothetical protein